MGLSARAQVAHLPADGESLTVLPAGGGGKTAWTIAHRRITNGGKPGVAVLMRCTLRLLTLDQLTAAGIICALELMRWS
jgi:hypothetical protein